MPDIPAEHHPGSTVNFNDTIPLQAVFEWLRQQDIPVVVIPGADPLFLNASHIKIISDLLDLMRRLGPYFR